MLCLSSGALPKRVRLTAEADGLSRRLSAHLDHLVMLAPSSDAVTVGQSSGDELTHRTAAGTTFQGIMTVERIFYTNLCSPSAAKPRTQYDCDPPLL